MIPKLNYDCLLCPGGPLIVSSPFTFNYFDPVNFLNNIENGFYDDYDPYDNFEIFKKFDELGQSECLESLLDHSGADFDGRNYRRSIYYINLGV